MIRRWPSWLSSSVLAASVAACVPSSSGPSPDAAPGRPDAEVITCGALPNDPHGQFDPGCGNTPGSTCTLSCDEGFEATLVVATCQDGGGWVAGSCTLELDGDGDGLRRYPWGTDLDDDADGARTYRFGGTDYDDTDAGVTAHAGGGTFTAGTPIALSINASPTDIDVGDVDRDGDLDLVTTNQDSGDLQVLLNNGDGTFTVPPPLVLGPAMALGGTSGGGSISLGDYDLDDNLDIFAARRYLYLGSRTGAFTAGTQLGWGSVGSTRAADVNDDDFLDLVGASGAGLAVMPSAGNGGWDPGGAVTTSVASVTRIAVGFLDGDDVLDVAAATSASTVVPLLGDGDGTYTAGAALATGYVEPIAIGDLGGDGLADLVACNPIATSTVIATATGAGYDVAVGPIGPSSSCSAAHLLDVDGDGDRDLVATYQVGGLALSLNTAGVLGAFAVQALPGAFAVAAGDLDGDGTLDLAVTSISADTVTVFFGDS